MPHLPLIGVPFRFNNKEMEELSHELVNVPEKEVPKVFILREQFDKLDEEGTIQIGRVLTMERKKGLGSMLLHECMHLLKEKKIQRAYLEAQEYATGFYEKEGFYIDSDVFLEDGIPHVCMRWRNSTDC